MFDIFSGATQATPDSLTLRRKMAAALMQRAGDTSPVQAWTQGAGRIADGLLGGLEMRGADRQETASREASIKDFMAALSGGAGAASSAPAASPSISPPPVAFSDNKVYGNDELSPLDNLDLKEKIKKFEGFAPTAAWDYKQNSNGFGTRAAYAGESIDPATAEARLSDEVAKARAITDRVNPNMPTGASDALTSLTFNAGDKWKNAGLGQAVQAGDMGAAKSRLLQYNQAGGDVLPGLVNRRQQEAGWMPDANSPVRVASLGGAPTPDSIPAPAQPAAPAPVQVAQAGGGVPSAGGQPGVNPALIRALSNQFLPPAMGQIAAGQINQQLAPPAFKQIGQSILGQPEYGWVNPKNQSVTPVNGGGGQAGGGDISADPSFKTISTAVANGATPDQVYQHVPTELREAVKSIVDGRGVPANIGSRGPARTAAMLYAHAVDPTFDEALIPQRMTFARSMGSTAPSSVGGQKILLGTSLGHLSDAADSAVDLNNVNGMGSADLAHISNAARGRTTAQAAKVLALEDKMQKFSGEVGKLYSGSAGGGVHEREETRARINGNKSSEELAAGLEANRDLILSKLNALEEQRDAAFGPGGKNRIEFKTPQVQRALDNLDAKIKQLRGGGAATAAPQQGQPAAPITKSIGGKNYIQQNGQWFEQ